DSELQVCSDARQTGPATEAMGRRWPSLPVKSLRNCVQVDPGLVAAAGFEGGGDEAHAFDTVFDVGDEQGSERGRAAFAAGVNLLGEIGVKLREGFEIALGMSGGNATGVRGG